MKLIRTLFFWLKVISSLCNLTETIMHNSIVPLDVVESDTFMWSGRRQSVDVDKKIGYVKKHSTFTDGYKYHVWKAQTTDSKNAIDSAVINSRRQKLVKVFGKRRRKTTFATIARELTRLMKLIRTLFFLHLL
jgi:hypothetical protein